MKAAAFVTTVAAGLAAACLTPRERRGKTHVYRRAVDSPDPEVPIGKGDRFDDGTTLPVGVGTDDRTMATILSVDEINSGLRALADAYDDVELVTAPHETYEGRTVYGIAIGAEPRVFINAGVHARERGGPDAVLYLAADILAAASSSGDDGDDDDDAAAGLTYGDKSFSHDDVVDARAAGIVIFPLANPDGVAYDQATNACWRKNRNPESADDDDEQTVGVDINRNFDFLWNVTESFNQDAPYGQYAASSDPAAADFHGTSPMSEPETRNIGWVLGSDGTSSNYGAGAAWSGSGSLSWFIDVHSIAGRIFYAWGDDDTQTTDPSQRFDNPDYDGKRGWISIDEPAEPDDSVYREYMEPGDLAAQEDAAARVAAAMNDVNPEDEALRNYTASPTGESGPFSGGSNDYALSLYYAREPARCGANRVQGLGMEFGREGDEGDDGCAFYPTAELFNDNLRQVAAGLLELVVFAAGEAGEVKQRECCK